MPKLTKRLVESTQPQEQDLLPWDREISDFLCKITPFGKIRKKYPKVPKIHLILDKGPYNTSEDTKKAVQKDNIILHYLPPYSPNLNPIERLWKVTNEHARNNRFFKTAPEFRQEIFHFFEVTWPQISLQMANQINDFFSPVKSSVSI